MSTIGNIFKDVGHGIKVAAEDFKNAVVKAAQEAPIILGVVQKDAPEVAALAELAFPQAGTVVNGGVSLLEEVASVIEQGGQSAEQNFLNAGLDQATIDGIKGLIPAFKAFVAASKKA